MQRKQALQPRQHREQRSTGVLADVDPILIAARGVALHASILLDALEPDRHVRDAARHPHLHILDLEVLPDVETVLGAEVQPA